MRINDKKEEIRKYLEELESIIPEDFNEYKSNFEKKAACKRYFEKIIGACIDLAFLIIKDKKLETPPEDRKAFEVLSGNRVISDEISGKLKEAKGMRNIIAHEYGEVDEEIVFNSISSELINDAEKFLEEIEKNE